jgi:membrane associated rhomboid family serine protease
LRQRFPLLTVTAIGVLAGAWLGSLLHGGVLQAILCLSALAIFGGSVEDALGRRRYVLLIALGAAGALAAQLAAGPHAGAPTLTCAGIVAAVLGAHVALHPTARVHSVLFAPMLSSVVAVPALALVGLWLALQVALGLGLDEPLAGIGGAWFAHLAAFGVGLIAARPLAHHGWARQPTARAAA